MFTQFTNVNVLENIDQYVSKCSKINKFLKITNYVNNRFENIFDCLRFLSSLHHLYSLILTASVFYTGKQLVASCCHPSRRFHGTWYLNIVMLFAFCFSLFRIPVHKNLLSFLEHLSQSRDSFLAYGLMFIVVHLFNLILSYFNLQLVFLIL